MVNAVWTLLWKSACKRSSGTSGCRHIIYNYDYKKKKPNCFDDEHQSHTIGLFFLSFFLILFFVPFCFVFFCCCCGFVFCFFGGGGDDHIFDTSIA